jgi:hypothetical protein
MTVVALHNTSRPELHVTFTDEAGKVWEVREYVRAGDQIIFRTPGEGSADVRLFVPQLNGHPLRHVFRDGDSLRGGRGLSVRVLQCQLAGARTRERWGLRG